MKKIINMLFCCCIIIGLITPAIAEEKTSEILAEVQEYEYNGEKYKRIITTTDKEVLVYDTRTGIVVDRDTDEIVAIIREEVIVDNPPLMATTSTYSGITIASRWIYSYSTRTSVTAYNATVSIISSLIVSTLAARNAQQLNSSIIQLVASQILTAAYSLHGSSAEVLYYNQTRRYSNRNYISDFANIYEEVTENGTITRATGYDSRICSEAG